MLFRGQNLIFFFMASCFLVQCSSVKDNTAKNQSNYSEYDTELSYALEDFDLSEKEKTHSVQQEKKEDEEDDLAHSESALDSDTSSSTSLEEEFEKELSEQEKNITDNSVKSEEDLVSIFEKELAAEEELEKKIEPKETQTDLEKDFESLMAEDKTLQDEKNEETVSQDSSQEGMQKKVDSHTDTELSDSSDKTEEEVISSDSEAYTDKTEEIISEKEKEDGFKNLAEDSSQDESFKPVRTWIPVKKMSLKPFRKGGQWVNSIYFARPYDNLEIIATKVYGNSDTSRLLKINPHFKNKSLKVGDKVYYNSPTRPQDQSQVLTYYEELGLSPETYVSKDAENIRVISRKLLGDSGSWKEVWAYNPQIESKDVLPSGTVIRYWPQQAHKKVLTAVSSYNSQIDEHREEDLASENRTFRKENPVQVETEAVIQEDSSQQKKEPNHSASLQNNPQTEKNTLTSESHIPQQQQMAQNNSSDIPVVEPEEEVPSEEAEEDSIDGKTMASTQSQMSKGDGIETKEQNLIDYASYGALVFGVLGLIFVVARRRKLKVHTSPFKSSHNHNQDTQVTQVTQVE